MNYATHLILSSLATILLYINCIQARRMHHVTCGSVLKLSNIETKVRLHSHDIKYGTGSGQQSVTGIDRKEDGNSYWLIKAENGKQCTRGEKFECGSTIRLEHLTTQKNLHSHYVSSPLSGNQEVSAYGNKGEGDTGDNWILQCETEFWDRDQGIKLQHADTGRYLAVSGRTYGNPISGQMEVIGLDCLHCDKNPRPHATWLVGEGLFMHPSDVMEQHRHHHTEL